MKRPWKVPRALRVFRCADNGLPVDREREGSRRRCGNRCGRGRILLSCGAAGSGLGLPGARRERQGVAGAQAHVAPGEPLCTNGDACADSCARCLNFVAADVVRVLRCFARNPYQHADPSVPYDRTAGGNVEAQARRQRQPQAGLLLICSATSRRCFRGCAAGAEAQANGQSQVIAQVVQQSQPSVVATHAQIA
jgi:hypothetical protein